MHARAASENCETRRSHSELCESYAWSADCQTTPHRPFVDACIPFRRKADTGPDGGIPQTAPAEHALVTQRHRSAFLQRNRRSGPTQRAFRRRTHATSYYERSRCCPGPTVIRTRRGLPSAAHQTKRPLLRTTPPRPRNAQGHFERRRRRGPGNESTGADPKSTNANTAAAAAPKRTNDGQLPAPQPPYRNGPEPPRSR